jgi:hypothetical protein
MSDSDGDSLISEDHDGLSEPSEVEVVSGNFDKPSFAAESIWHEPMLRSLILSHVGSRDIAPILLVSKSAFEGGVRILYKNVSLAFFRKMLAPIPSQVGRTKPGMARLADSPRRDIKCTLKQYGMFVY